MPFFSQCKACILPALLKLFKNTSLCSPFCSAEFTYVEIVGGFYLAYLWDGPLSRGSSQWEWASPSWEFGYHLAHISTYTDVANTSIAGGYYLFMCSLLDNGVLSSDINRKIFLQQNYIHEYRGWGHFKLHKSVLKYYVLFFQALRSCCTVMLQLFPSVHSCEGPNHLSMSSPAENCSHKNTDACMSFFQKENFQCWSQCLETNSRVTCDHLLIKWWKGKPCIYTPNQELPSQLKLPLLEYCVRLVSYKLQNTKA